MTTEARFYSAPTWRGLAIILQLLMLSGVVARSTYGQENPCDPELLKQAYRPYGYALHGERCEGIYKQQVGGTLLWLASLTQAFESYDLTSGSDLIVEWTAPESRGARIRAQGIRGDLYYRMDAVRAAGSRAFQWHTDLLAAQGITREDLGVLGWTRYPVGGIDRDFHSSLPSQPKTDPTYTDGPGPEPIPTGVKDPLRPSRATAVCQLSVTIHD